MCGLAGFWTENEIHQDEMYKIALSMCRSIQYRGPDDEGVWCDDSTGLALGHKRLSILELSQAGHQPMMSYDQSLCLVFNGEIYNHLDLRVKLESFMSSHCYVWNGRSDTETLLVAIEAWGIEKTLQAIVGMFSFVLWNKNKRTLTLARDRMGEKPLYYGMQNGQFIFASELKALRAYPHFDFEIDDEGLGLFFQYNYISSPFSIYKDVYKLIPGTWLEIDVSNINNSSSLMPSPYWSLHEVICKNNQQYQGYKDDELLELLDGKLSHAVSRQMLSDVSLGGFLSGGIDSSLIVSYMQKISSQPINTFTIGFNDSRYNEAIHAKEVAKHLGTHHTELYLSDQDMLDTVPMIPKLYDEPFSDASQIPTFLVCQLARKEVTVCLSGDGGDELFGGYNRYIGAIKIWKKFHFFPYCIRAAIAGVIRRTPPEFWNNILKYLMVFLPTGLRTNSISDNLNKVAKVLSCYSSSEIYNELVSHWKIPSKLVTSLSEQHRKQPEIPSDHELELQMMYLDSISYLPDDVLTKVDRAAMGCSLETRVPFLDLDVIEFAWKLPLNTKIRNGEGKWILRQLLYRHLPRKLIDRPKSGFSVPMAQWLNGPLKPLVFDMLSSSRVSQDGLLDVDVISNLKNDFYSGNISRAYEIWPLLVFQMWHDEYGK